MSKSVSAAAARRPLAQPRDRLHRIVVLADASHHLIKLAAQPLARDYLRHAGVPPMLRLVRTEAEATSALRSPVSGTAPRASPMTDAECRRWAALDDGTRCCRRWPG